DRARRQAAGRRAVASRRALFRQAALPRILRPVRRQLDPRVTARIPDGGGRRGKSGIGEIAGGDADLIGREFGVPIDRAAADRTEVIVEPASGIGGAAPQLRLALDGVAGALRPIGRDPEHAAGRFLAFEAMADRDLGRITFHGQFQLAAGTGCDTGHCFLRGWTGCDFTSFRPRRPLHNWRISWVLSMPVYRPNISTRLTDVGDAPGGRKAELT